MIQVRVELPAHLRSLARVEDEVTLSVPPEPTIADVLDALEACYPMLRGTIRDHDTHRRRSHMRYFAAGEDVSHEPAHLPIPRSVASGDEAFRVLGAISGG